MTEEELKDKYSAFIAEVSEIMGLGKPVDILRLCAVTDSFFRPLNKRIEALEKENAELKDLAQRLDFFYEGNGFVKRGLISSIMIADYLDAIEKENAELKRNKKTVVHLAEFLEEKQEEQLTKAKEIIKGLLSCCRNYPQENAKKIEQAEQFLKEIEK